MHIQQEDSAGKGRFFIQEAGNDVAEIVYTHRGASGIVILHTGVDEHLEGKGVGRRLVDAVAAWARAANLRITPVCAFAKKVMEHNPAFSDVLEAKS